MLAYILNTVRELCKENFYWIWGLNQDPTAADTVLFCLFLTCLGFTVRRHTVKR